MAKKKSMPTSVDIQRSSTERRIRRDRRALTPPAAIPISIISIGLRDLALRELIDPASGASRQLGAKIPKITFSLNASIDFPEPAIATLTLHAKVRDAADQPLVEVELRLTGIFRYQGDLSQRDVGTYLSKMGGGILFPYAREAVHSVSARTLFGPMVLPPTIVTPLFTEGQLASLADTASRMPSQVTSGGNGE